MKKAFFATIAALIALSLAACGEQVKPQNTPAPEASANKAEATEVPTNAPTAVPSEAPTEAPTAAPTEAPTPPHPLETDEEALELAWAYAKLANELYGFDFSREDPSFIRDYPSLEFWDGETNESIMIFFDYKDYRRITDVVIFGGSMDAPDPAAHRPTGEVFYLETTVSLPSFTVTWEELEAAGYTLEGSDRVALSDEDYLKITEYCAKIKAAALTDCPESDYNHCNAAEVYRVYNIEGRNFLNGYTICMRPSYPHYFTAVHSDIGCGMVPPDDAEHAGWITLGGHILISRVDGGVKCEFTYLN